MGLTREQMLALSIEHKDSAHGSGEWWARRAEYAMPESYVMPEKMDNFTCGYIIAALWSSTDDDGNPLDRDHDQSDIAEETLREMSFHCDKFQQDNMDALVAYYDAKEYDPSQGTVADYAGHDFWLTRNGHGAGFWDRYEVSEPTRDLLTKASRAYGYYDLYIGDDGQVWA